MPKLGDRLCPVCEMWMDKAEAENLGMVATLGEYEGRIVHDRCWSEDAGDKATICYIDTYGDREDYYLGHVGLHGEWDESMRPTVWEYARSILWRSSDAWRGHYQGSAPEGWEVVEDTWFCGFDGKNVEGILELFHNKWRENDWVGIPCEVLMGLVRTSNVFSTGFELYVPEGKKDDFISWVQS